MKPIHSYRRLASAVLLTLTTAGCTDDPSMVDTRPRVEVSGNVTFDGKPLPAGRVQFEPLASESGTISVGEIKDGKFSIPQAKGLVPGNYRVAITSGAPREIKETEEPGPLTKPEPEVIPVRYNRKSELKAEVKPEGPNSFDFSLVKKS